MLTALLILCGLLAGAGKAVADAQAHGSARLARWFPKWAGPNAWRLKYRNDDPAQGPRFWLADTLLVFLTDTWHFANAITWLAWAGMALTGCFVGRAGFVPMIVALALSKLAFVPAYKWLRTPLTPS